MKQNRLLIIALVAVALGVGIYAIVGKGSNTQTADAGGQNTCPGTVDFAKSLDPIATGEIAAFQSADETRYLGGETFKDKDGKDVSIADWKGRTMLVNLWATWCAPCRREMPALQALEVAEGDETFEVVPISVDLGEDAKPKKFYADNKLDELPFYADGTMAVFNNLKKYGYAFGMPSTLLIDKNSCVLGVLNGPAEWASEDAVKLIKAAKALGS